MKFTILFVTISVFAVWASAVEELFRQDVFAVMDTNYECLDTQQRSVGEPLPEKPWTSLKYLFCIDNEFSMLERRIIWQAFNRFTKSILKRKTFDCFERAGVPFAGLSHAEFLKSWVLDAAYPMPSTGQTHWVGNVFVSPLKNNTTHFAEGFLNNVHKSPVTKDKKWLKHVSIGVNREVIGSEKYPYGNDVGFWSVQLGIAYFRNMGIASDNGSPWNSTQHHIAECLIDSHPL